MDDNTQKTQPESNQTTPTTDDKADNVKIEQTAEKTTTQPTQPKSKKKKKKGPKLLRGRAQAHIKSTYNNTIVSITDQSGNVICSSCAGKCGFKGPKKSTPYAAGIIVRSLADKMKMFGIKDLDVFVKGVGMGRESAIRAFGVNNINVISIKDVTPIPHNGCRPKKPRKP